MTTTLSRRPRRYRYDWALFADWCTAADLPFLPAAPSTLALFLAEHPAAAATQRARVTASLEHLDLLLATVARPRIVHRDGIHFQGLRYLDPTLAAYVREPVTIRYDPRDITEIRVFHRGRFLCKAVSPDHAEKTISLKDIETARRAHRRQLRAGVRERIAVVADYLPEPHPAPHQNQPPTEEPRRRLRTYMEG